MNLKKAMKMFPLLVEIKRRLARAIQLLIFHFSEVAEPWQNLSEFCCLFVCFWVCYMLFFQPMYFAFEFQCYTLR